MSRHVAIIGAGPAGCFLAQALLKARPELNVDLVDRLPVPYGLVRYGVAADHQGTKAVTRQFARLFERQGAQFFGNVELGRDVTLEQLREAYDAVVIATGLSADRMLGVPGDGHRLVFGAGRITRALHEHPDALPLPALGPRPLIIGNGNVAIDLLRLLAKLPHELDGSDLGAGPSDWLENSGIAEITILGRAPAGSARFDPVMVRELGRLAGVAIELDDVGEAANEEGRRRIEALQAVARDGAGARKIRFLFGKRPVAVEDCEAGVALRWEDASGGAGRIEASAIITAIGFEADRPHERHEMQAQAGAGVYAAGWFARGPRGTIPENRADAQVLAGTLLADLDAMPQVTRQGRKMLARLDKAVGYECWARIDAAETASPPVARCRVKIATRQAMLALGAAPNEKESET